MKRSTKAPNAVKPGDRLRLKPRSGRTACYVVTGVTRTGVELAKCGTPRKPIWPTTWTGLVRAMAPQARVRRKR